MIPRSHSNILIRDTSEVKPIRDSAIFWYMQRGALWGTQSAYLKCCLHKVQELPYFVFQNNFNISLTIQNILHHWFAITFCSGTDQWANFKHPSFHTQSEILNVKLCHGEGSGISIGVEGQLSTTTNSSKTPLVAFVVATNRLYLLLGMPVLYWK